MWEISSVMCLTPWLVSILTSEPRHLAGRMRSKYVHDRWFLRRFNQIYINSNGFNRALPKPFLSFYQSVTCFSANTYSIKPHLSSPYLAPWRPCWILHPSAWLPLIAASPRRLSSRCPDTNVFVSALLLPLLGLKHEAKNTNSMEIFVLLSSHL